MKDVLLGRIEGCRICGHQVSSPVVELGELALSGVFAVSGKNIPRCSMSLTKCLDENCGLLQLLEVYDLSMLYGEHYGYASSLNPSMVRHLQAKAHEASSKVLLENGDIVIDIGSNDATTLSQYPDEVFKIGIDVVGQKYISNYEAIGATLIEDFFPSRSVDHVLKDKKAKIISSYSCFYDLPDPVEFAAGVAGHLALDGIWVLEQSYLGSMLRTNSFDTICHEHVEYYLLSNIQKICSMTGLKIIDVSLNDINGGSFSVQVALEKSEYMPSKAVAEMLAIERKVDWFQEIDNFAKNVSEIKTELLAMLDHIGSSGKKVYGLGASTKGNVLLQYFNLSTKQIVAIGEVNHEKYGRETPGSCIPIISEDQLFAEEPDYLLVLPWHFKSYFLSSPKYKGYNFIFPLPYPLIVEN